MSKIVSYMFVAVGLAFMGFMPFKYAIDTFSDKPIEVRGLAEKTVKSDRCWVQIDFDAESKNLERAEEKIQRITDIVLNDIRSLGIPDNEINTSTKFTKVDEQPANPTNEKDLQQQQVVDLPQSKERKFKISRVIRIDTKNVEVPEKLKKLMLGWISRKVWVNMDYEYMLSDFNSCKKELLKTASANALEMAEVFAAPLNVKIKELKFMKQGIVDISAADSIEEESAYRSYSPYGDNKGTDHKSHRHSLYKKLRLVVNAGFCYKSPCCKIFGW